MATSGTTPALATGSWFEGTPTLRTRPRVDEKASGDGTVGLPFNPQPPVPFLEPSRECTVISYTACRPPTPGEVDVRLSPTNRGGRPALPNSSEAFGHPALRRFPCWYWSTGLLGFGKAKSSPETVPTHNVAGCEADNRCGSAAAICCVAVHGPAPATPAVFWPGGTFGYHQIAAGDCGQAPGGDAVSRSGRIV